MSNPSFNAPDYTTQDAATYKANIDASVASNGADSINIGFSYSSGTFTVHDAQGTALSATNPGFVKFIDKANPGYVRYASVEANQAFIDDAGASEIINNLFGFTTSVAITDDVPFFLYAVLNDDASTVQFMISRIPHRVTAPAVAEIGAPDDAVADAQYSFFSFDNIDETAFDGNPCTVLGSFNMQMSASDDWTVQAITTSDGIGRFNEQTWYDMPLGQFGANASTLTINNGGTAPVFTTPSGNYKIEKSGICHYHYTNRQDGGTDGTGAVDAQFIVPFLAEKEGGDSLGYLNGVAQVYYASSNHAVNATKIPEDSNYLTVYDAAGAIDTSLEWGDFATGSRSITGSIIYPVITA